MWASSPAAALHERCLALARRNARRDVRWAESELVLDLYQAGEWDDAARAADEYLHGAESAPYWADVQSYATRARMRFAQGEFALASADSDRSLAIGRDYGGGQVLLPILALRARHVATTDPGEANSLVDAVLDRIVGRRWIWTPYCLVDLAYALCRLGRGGELGKATTAVARTPWLEAALAVTTGAFTRAVDVLSAIGSRPEEAYARLGAADQLLCEGRRREADDQLARGLAFWLARGATAYAREAERRRSS
jgi:hypothetical protein